VPASSMVWEVSNILPLGLPPAPKEGKMRDEIEYMISESSKYGVDVQVIETSKGDLLLFFCQEYIERFDRYEPRLISTQYIPN